MIPIVQDEIVEKEKMISSQEFLDSVAFATGLPGAIIVNLSIFIGNKVSGFAGAILSALGAVLPAYISMIVLATVFNAISSSEIIQAIFMGIRPTIIVMIAVSVYSLMKSTDYGKYGIYFAGGALIALLALDISAVLVVITAGFAGAIFYSMKGVRDAQ